MVVKVYTDGIAEPRNPGPAAYGYVVYEDDVVVERGGGYIGETSNNVAEYTAIIEALRCLQQRGYTGEVIVYSDSQLIVNQLNRRWRVHQEHLRRLRARVEALTRSFASVMFVWISREMNEEADKTSREALYTEFRRNPQLVEKYRGDFVDARLYEALRSHGYSVSPYTSRIEARRFLEKQESTPSPRSCFSCRWMERRGPHIGCFYGGEYQQWVSKKVAKRGCNRWESR